MKERISLNEEVRHIWNENAQFWDERMGEGNDWHKMLVEPATDRLLNIKPGEHVLDIACGNGQYTRRMAEHGAEVVAFDLSERLVERARVRSEAQAGRIEYRVLDATDYDGLMALGRHGFDAAVSCMALMDMADIEPLVRALSHLLKPDGRFVFSTCHPCFNSGHFKKVKEIEEKNGEVLTEHSISVRSYIRPCVTKGIAMIGQPVAQYYFHRPLSMILNTCFEAGFTMDRIEEPVFGESKSQSGSGTEFYRETPPVLVARFRLSA